MRIFGWGSRAFIYSPDTNGITYPIIRISRDDVPAALAHIDAVWEALSPDLPIDRAFVDERLAQSYALYRHVSTAFAILAGIAFAIALTGLLGMVLFVVGRRRHEMGVRKVLGATPPGVMRLLLWQFLRPVLIANVVVWPLAFIAARFYVDMFMYPIELTPLPFVLSLGVTVLVTCAVVARQALASARMKPAAVLRYE
jgi:putative ABC transport system permease protein